MSDDSVLPPHVEQTIEAIGALHREHHRRSTPSEHAVGRLINLVARPRFLSGVTVALAVWIGANGLVQLASGWAPDPPPFSYLQTLLGAAGVYVTVLILITQRRENDLAQVREQLTLQLAIQNAQTAAKIVALLEELRRDTPSVPNRRDLEAERLSVPADTQAVLDAIRSTTETSQIEGEAAWEQDATDGHDRDPG